MDAVIVVLVCTFICVVIEIIDHEIQRDKWRRWLWTL